MSDEIFLTVSLERKSEDDRLFYRVAIVDSCDRMIVDSQQEKEDYNEALIYARCAFDHLRNTYPHRVIASYVEQPHHLSNQGASYALNEFVIPDKKVEITRLYSGLAEEFDEMAARVENPDVNTIFRQLISKHKLSAEQENQFLGFLKKNAMVG